MTATGRRSITLMAIAAVEIELHADSCERLSTSASPDETASPAPLPAPIAAADTKPANSAVSTLLPLLPTADADDDSVDRNSVTTSAMISDRNCILALVCAVVSGALASKDCTITVWAPKLCTDGGHWRSDEALRNADRADNRVEIPAAMSACVSGESADDTASAAVIADWKNAGGSPVPSLEVNTLRLSVRTPGSDESGVQISVATAVYCDEMPAALVTMMTICCCLVAGDAEVATGTGRVVLRDAADCWSERGT